MSLMKGIAVWICGSLTFLAALNAFNAAMLWMYNSADFVVELYVIGGMLTIGGISVTNYLWVSLAATFGFLGLTSIIAFRGPSEYQTIFKMIREVQGDVAANRKEMDATKRGIHAKLELGDMARQELFETVNTNIDNVRKGTQKIYGDLLRAIQANLNNAREKTLVTLEKQGKTTKRDLASVAQASVDTRKELLSSLQKHGRAIERIGRSSQRGATAIQKQSKELEDVTARLERLEMQVLPPQPRLTSQTSLEEVKGIGPRLAEELKSIRISNVGEFVTADPAIIAEKTRVSPEVATRMQSTAQLLMIPGIEEDNAELLEKVGITTRSELARQDPIQLSRKIAENVKADIESGVASDESKPTIEEVTSWIKHA
jgi:predicted flap endonuclease-1-like 5' DNA nuclease